MQVIKGLAALVLTAAAVFASVVLYNSKTEPAYVAKIQKQTRAETVRVPHLATKKSGIAAGQNGASSKL
ncbi:MAG TPA: hypothetical protein VFV23_10380 [Verrucomicrobiae bacterium]|nr:hypothetical protein [Verrucomicrobiae bacterium]